MHEAVTAIVKVLPGGGFPSLVEMRLLGLDVPAVEPIVLPTDLPWQTAAAKRMAARRGDLSVQCGAWRAAFRSC
jgi:hypothetical protein